LTSGVWKLRRWPRRIRSRLLGMEASFVRFRRLVLQTIVSAIAVSLVWILFAYLNAWPLLPTPVGAVMMITAAVGLSAYLDKVVFASRARNNDRSWTKQRNSFRKASSESNITNRQYSNRPIRCERSRDRSLTRKSFRQACRTEHGTHKSVVPYLTIIKVQSMPSGNPRQSPST
jgi:hypothetical protein